MGEIDGFVYVSQEGADEKKPVPGLEVLLINTETNEEVLFTNSEYDGYYIFSALPLGKYTVQALPFWEGDNDSMPSLEIELTSDKPIVTDRNIIIPKIRNVEGAEVISTSETDSKTEKFTQVLEDEPVAVITSGLDIATGEALRGLFIHVGSLATFSSAQKEQKRLWQRYPDTLGKIPLYIYEIHIGVNTYYRIVGTVRDPSHGKKLCNALLIKEIAGGCSVVEF